MGLGQVEGRQGVGRGVVSLLRLWKCVEKGEEEAGQWLELISQMLWRQKICAAPTVLGPGVRCSQPLRAGLG
jgi:hypothetical protein